MVVLTLLGWRLTRHEGDLAGLTAFILIALVGNAFICGAMSNPHERYQSRVVWLAVLCVILAGQRILLRNTRSLDDSLIGTLSAIDLQRHVDRRQIER